MVFTTDIEVYKELCHSLAKAYTTGARLYEGEVPVYYYSVQHLQPDPMTPYLPQILESPAKAGIITTPLYQFYGFLALPTGMRMILGPTRALEDNGRKLEELMMLLGISPEQRADYAKHLRSAPLIHAERFAWLLASLGTALSCQPFPVENVRLEILPADNHFSVQSGYIRERLMAAEDETVRQAVQQGHAWEELICSYIQNGQPEQLRELLNAPPAVSTGRLAPDTLRQTKNIGICTAAVVSRVAIRGGLEPQDAFRISDLYIQKIELLRDAIAVERVIFQMLITFAEQVEKVHYPVGEESRFFPMCAKYVSQNIFSTIRTETMAKELGYTRAYLSNCFKQETGIPLAQYIQQEKVSEAKRLLQFTEQDLGEIAALFNFSSQSHFQTVFKKITGETPMAYRRRTKPI